MRQIEMDNLITRFKNREIKAKSIFSLKEIPKREAYDFIKKYHYLGEAKFFAKFCYGLFIEDSLVGAATYGNPQGIASMKSWFGLPNNDQRVMELTRLCMLPKFNGTNATSYLLGNSIKNLKRYDVKAVITLADNSRHVGSIYQVCNFKYYGLTAKKSDFYTLNGGVNPRGTTKDIQGVWLPRNRKHRYCFLLDKNFSVKISERTRPYSTELDDYECCDGTNRVLDRRFNVLYTCPKCTGKMEVIDKYTALA